MPAAATGRSDGCGWKRKKNAREGARRERGESVRGGVAQLVRARGSYPRCHWFESSRRYHQRVAYEA